jgi:hypothetical protein
LSSRENSRLRDDSAFVSEYSKELLERAKIKKLLDLKRTNNELRQLAKSRRLGGERLTAAAAVMFLTPDPLTTMASLPMFAAAQLMKSRKKSSDLGRVFEKAREELTALSHISQTLSSI